MIPTVGCFIFFVRSCPCGIEIKFSVSAHYEHRAMEKPEAHSWRPNSHHSRLEIDIVNKTKIFFPIMHHRKNREAKASGRYRAPGPGVSDRLRLLVNQIKLDEVAHQIASSFRVHNHDSVLTVIPHSSLLVQRYR